MNEEFDRDGEPFFPKGAVAFFTLMLAFFAAVWGGIYLLMLGRR